MAHGDKPGFSHFAPIHAHVDINYSYNLQRIYLYTGIGAGHRVLHLVMTLYQIFLYIKFSVTCWQHL